MSKKEFFEILKIDFSECLSREFCDSICFDEGYTSDYVSLIFPSIIPTPVFNMLVRKDYVFYISTRCDAPVLRIAIPGTEDYLI